jgi:hypothetical protein
MMSIADKIARSIEYGALDHKWLARKQLDEDPDNATLIEIATSAFHYYSRYRDVLSADRSIRALTELCSDETHAYDIDGYDQQVYHLSNVFNQIIKSNRRLFRCYDCGTNARAMFLKLVQAHRGISYITHDEQQRMSREYIVTYDDPAGHVMRCYREMLQISVDSVFIMSIAIQDFGHVWIIEKRKVGNKFRYHQYQTCLNSYLLMDYIEQKDYGGNISQSMDLESFYSDLSTIMERKVAWAEAEYRLFAKLFSFLPISKIVSPDPGFSYTYVSY